MEEPAQSYNHKIKVLSPEPNSAKHNNWPIAFFCPLPFSDSRAPSPSPQCHQPLCILYFENETENIKPEKLRIEHFHVCFPLSLYARALVSCICFGYAGLWHEDSNTIRSMRSQTAQHKVLVSGARG